MDSFNPFANAWGDDEGNSPSWGASTSTTAATATSNARDEHHSWDAHASQSPIAGPSFSRRFSDNDNDIDIDNSDGVPSWSHAAGAGASAVAIEDYQGSSSSPVAPPAAWSPQLDRQQDWRSQDTQEDREADDTATAAAEDDDTGFDGFGAARLPDLRPPDGHATAPHMEDTDDRSWGETDLPPSAWDERLNAKPTWESPSTKTEQEAEQGWGGRNELEIYPPPESEEEEEEQEQEPHTTRSGHSRQSSSQLQVTSPRIPSAGGSTTQDELAEIKRLQEEYGIQVRNLDEEYTSPSSEGRRNLSNEQASSSSASATTTRGRWSLFGRKSEEPVVAGNMSSITTGITQAQAANDTSASLNGSILPTGAQAAAFASKAGEQMMKAGEQVARAGEQAGRAASEQVKDAASTVAAAAAASAGGQGGGASKWFRFGRNRTVTSTSSEDAARAASDQAKTEGSSNSATSGTATEPDIATLGDFGQLENFNSGQIQSKNGGGGAYDDFGVSSTKGLDLELEGGQKSRWGLWGRGGPLSPGAGAAGGGSTAKHAALGRGTTTSTGIADDDDDFQGLDAAFSAPPPRPSQARPPNGEVDFFGDDDLSASWPSDPPRRTPSMRTRQQQMGAASMAAVASGMRSSSSMDAFDPLDPLSELRQRENRVRSTSKGAFSDYVASGNGEHPLRRSGSTSSAKNVSPFPMRAPLVDPTSTSYQRPRTVSPSSQPPRIAQSLAAQYASSPSSSTMRIENRPSTGPLAQQQQQPRSVSPSLFSLSQFAAPPVAAGREGGTVVRMSSNPPSRPASTGPPPPLLAPPPGFAGIRRSPSPSAGTTTTSLIDDFADLLAPTTATATAPKPVPVQAASSRLAFGAPRPSTAVPPTLQQPPNSNGQQHTSAAVAADDDFGEFTDFTSAPTANSGPPSLPAATKPIKASGPMKLAPPGGTGGAGKAGLPRELEKELGPRPSKNADLDFFDSLL